MTTVVACRMSFTIVLLGTKMHGQCTTSSVFDIACGATVCCHCWSEGYDGNGRGEEWRQNVVVEDDKRIKGLVSKLLQILVEGWA